MVRVALKFNVRYYQVAYLGGVVKNDYYYDYFDGSYGMGYFGSDGKLANYTGWHKVYEGWYYFNDSHVAIEGFTNIDGKIYYLYPKMATGWDAIWTQEGYKFYQFDSNGALIGKDTTQNGWVERDGQKYYYKNGEILNSTIAKIDGKLYGFTYDAVLAKNTTVHYYNDIFFCGSDGTVAATKGWKQNNYGRWYYTLEDGRCLTGIQKIDGKTYYFNYSGEWMR